MLIPILALAIFLLPISPNLKIDDKHLTLEINKTSVSAAVVYNKITLNQGVGTIKDTYADFSAVVMYTNSTVHGDMYSSYSYVPPSTSGGSPQYLMIVNVHDVKAGTDAGIYKLPFEILKDEQTIPIHLTNLTAKTDYLLTATIFTDSVKENYNTQTAKEPFTTAVDPNSNGSGGGSTNPNDQVPGELDLQCGVGSWLGGGSLYGCVAGLFYIVFSLVAMLAHLAAIILDFFVYYSTNSTSYTSGFVTEGWKAIRDVANIFFIIALLYVAIKTILSLNVTNNKKLIGTIVIVALLINFSLFFTQVIIDGSNILAKVFYNNIDSKYENKKPATGNAGEKSVSVGLVNKFNPELMISQKQYDETGGTTTYIFVTFILTAILLYTTYIFFVVSLLFVSRVASLWISMVFSPIAFASYTLPFDIPGLGHKEWWSELLKNAFLAPIFIFFLYIIIMFAGFLNKIVIYPAGTDIFQKMMAIIIPFIIIFILLMKSKDIAVKYSGEMGKAFQKAGAMIGGAAVGVGLGATALAGRYTLGRAATAAANSGWAKKWEAAGWGGGTAKRLLEKGSKGSFDARGIKVGGKSLSDTGLKVGKAKEGGYEKMRKDKVEKRQKRAQGLEVGENEKMKQTLNKTERDLQELLKNDTAEIERLDKAIARAKEINDPIQIAAAKQAKDDHLDGLIVAKGVNAGKTAKTLQGQANEQKSGILQENRNRKWNYAKKRWGYGSKEAAHKIRMEDKLDTGTKTH